MEAARHLTLTIVLVALAMGGHAKNEELQSFFPRFPFCQCRDRITAYNFTQVPSYKGNNTYCWRIKVGAPPTCDSYCCTKADLKKMEMNVHPSCDVTNPALRGTLNGNPTKDPGFDRAPQGPSNAVILRLTQLGLNRTNADGAEICITLGPNKLGQGCTTLEALCIPPADPSRGVCDIVLFDSLNDCCSFDVFGSPPPPSPLRPSPLAPSPLPPAEPPLRPPPAPPCTICTYITFTPPKNVDPDFPFTFTPAHSAAIINKIIIDINAEARSAGAVVYSPFVLVESTPTKIKICGRFASDAEGQKLAGRFDNTLTSGWLSTVTLNCPAYMNDYVFAIDVGGDDSDVNNLPPSCLKAHASILCNPPPLSYPKCVCNTTEYITQFAPVPTVTKKPGRTSSTTLYCFSFTTLPSASVIPGPCAKDDMVFKVEFYFNDTLRSKVKKIWLQPGSATSMTAVNTLWAATGDDTLKVTNLNWSPQKMRGAQICVEVDSATPLGSLCKGSSPGICWLNIFNPDKDCCPVYPVTFTQ